jgi:ABC toxin N-terminal region/Neuraminidase-like domain/Putative peptidoglycan binding domain
MPSERIGIGSVGEDVARLHEALEARGFAVSAEEAKRRFFGPSTRDALRDCQTCHGLNATGEVDDSTTALLNAARPPARAGIAVARDPAGPVTAPDRAAEPESFQVYGRVVGSKGTPVPDLVVAVSDQDIVGENRLGEATTDAKGEYRVVYTEQAFRVSVNERRGPDIVVRVYDSQRNLLLTTKALQNASAEAHVDLKLPERKYIVRGRVTGASEGMQVVAYDKDLRSEQQLGKPFALNDDGQYVIEYDAADFARAEKGTADLRVAVRDADKTELHSSQILFNAGPDVTVDLTLPAASISELERYLRETAPLLEGVSIVSLDIKDVDFIAADTGIDRQHIQWLVKAAQSQVNTASSSSQVEVDVRHMQDHGYGSGVPVTAFYGWFRLGMPTELSALWQRSSEELMATLREALAQRIIPRMGEADQQRVRTAIEEVKIDQALNKRASETQAALGDLLATLPASPTSEQQRALAAAIGGLRPDDPQLTERVAAVPGFDGDAPAVARTLRLGALTGNHIALTRALQDRMQQADQNDGTLRPLAALSPDEWIELAYVHGVPEGAATSPPAYAARLAAQVEHQHPTMALAAHLTEGAPLSRHPLLHGVGRFLRDNPTFDIVSANINSVEATPELGHGLVALQRLNILGVTWQEAATLLENDLHSPQLLLAAGPAQLAEILDGQIAPERIAVLHKQAAEMHSTTFAAITAAFSPLSAPNVLPGYSAAAFGGDPLPDAQAPQGPVGLGNLPYMLKAETGHFDPNKYRSIGYISSALLEKLNKHWTFGNDVVHQPTLQYLFGSQDACACRDCNSVLSPAAYFVDVMQFIRKAAPNSQMLERLLHRRPDLQDIELTCENSHTEVPAIDLALEILENAVALPLAIALPAGTSLDTELQDKKPVGATIRAALERTVRSFDGEGRATWVGANRDGSTDWAVVDRHRRWTLNTRPADGMVAQDAIRGSRDVDLTNVDIAAFVASLDRGTISPDAENAIVGAIAPNQTAELANYQVSVTTVTPGQEWSLAYRVVAEMAISDSRNQLDLRIPGGKTWWSKRYNPKTLKGLKDEFTYTFPELARRILIARFPDVSRPSIEKIKSRREEIWRIDSRERTVTLKYAPAHLNITSLAYQSGEPGFDPIAQPENHNAEAYARLKGAIFPWSLPMDLPLEESRLFLERARSSRRELIALAAPLDSATSRNLALEFFGLSEAEARLIFVEESPAVDVAAATAAIYDQWGLAANQRAIYDAAMGRNVQGESPLELLTNVSILLQQSRLRFDELQMMLDSQFVTQDGAPLIILPLGSCKPSEMKVVALTVGHLDRLHRLVRLWRKSGWTVHELDLAVRAFGGVLTPQTLLDLADFRRVQEMSGMPVTALVGALDRLETRPWVDYLAEDAPEQDSHYAKIFQRQQARKLSDYAAFALRADGTELLNTVNSGISAHAEYVGNCIGVEAAIVEKWVLAENVLGISDQLDLANLSRLSGAAGVCTALRMKPELLAHVLELLGQTASPFRAQALTARERLNLMQDFVERYRNLAKSDVDAETLRYVLQHFSPPGSSAVLSAGQVSQLAAAARDAVLSIPDATTQPADAAERAAAERAIRVAREDAAVAALASGLDAPSDLVDELLRKRLRHPADATKVAVDVLLTSAPAGNAIADVITRLHKSALLCAALKLTKADLPLMRASATAESGFSVLSFETLPVADDAPAASIESYERLLALLRLRSAVPNGADLLHRYVDTGRAALATGFSLSEDEVNAAAERIGLTTDVQARDPIALEKLLHLLLVLKKIGATVALLDRLSAASPDAPTAIAARELLRGKFGDSQWHDLIKPLEDQMRARQRDTLVEYLIFRDKLRDANDLYEYYLIDVQTGSCMKTTRLLQATAAVQLFVQRVTLNLERGASLSADKRALWDWMHSYRVWEANRKVFLFPENWLLPELRDDKTAQFRQMESALSEGEPTQDSMRSTLIGYVEELGDTADIRVISMYQDEREIDGDTRRTLYIVGRTPNSPYRYFWRSCAEFGTPEMWWSGWEAIDLDNANDFIMPFIFEGDLHMAWPVFHKTKEERREDKDTAKLLWEVQIAWTRRTNKGWTKRKVGKAQLTGIERLSNKDEASSFAFRLNKSVIPVGGSSLMRERVTIDCYAAREQTPIPSAIPDLSRVDAEPTGAPYDARFGPNYAWNVACTVKGTVYRYFKRPTEEGGITTRWTTMRRRSSRMC